MLIQKNRDGSYSAFMRVGKRMFIAEGASRAEAFTGLLDMVRHTVIDNRASRVAAND